MKSKEKQFTVRVSEDLHGKASNKASSMNVPLAELMRISLTSFCTQMESGDTNPTEKLLHSQLEAATEARTRSDTIIMQLSKQIERQHLQIEDLTKPKPQKSVWGRISSLFAS